MCSDDFVGYHRDCGARVYRTFKPGYRPRMSNFAEPDEVGLRCERGHTVEKDEVSEEEITHE